jgi:carboxylesterase
MSCNDHSSGVRAGRVGILLMQPPGEAASPLPAIAAGLARAGYDVRCLQLATISKDGGKLVRWWDWYANAEAALADLRRTCDVVVAGGMSTGAALGLLLAANHPSDVQATALFAPTLWLNGQFTPRAARLVCLALGRRAAEAIGISSWRSPATAAGRPRGAEGYKAACADPAFARGPLRRIG